MQTVYATDYEQLESALRYAGYELGHEYNADGEQLKGWSDDITRDGYHFCGMVARLDENGDVEAMALAADGTPHSLYAGGNYECFTNASEWAPLNEFVRASRLHQLGENVGRGNPHSV